MPVEKQEIEQIKNREITFDNVKPELIAQLEHEKKDDIFKRKLRQVLNLPIPTQVTENFEKYGLNLKEGDLADAMSMSMVLQAVNGNTTAYTIIRDTMGCKPIDNIKSDVKISIEMSQQARELGE